MKFTVGQRVIVGNALSVLNAGYYGHVTNILSGPPFREPVYCVLVTGRAERPAGEWIFDLPDLWFFESELEATD